MSRRNTSLIVIEAPNGVMELNPGDNPVPRAAPSQTGEGGMGEVWRSQDTGATMDGASRETGTGSGYYPAGALLNRWCEWDLQDGLQIDHLKDLQMLTIRT